MLRSNLYYCCIITSRTKRILSEVNNHERIKIRKLYLGKMKDTEDELETNITSETPFTRTLNKFIHYLFY